LKIYGISLASSRYTGLDEVPGGVGEEGSDQEGRVGELRGGGFPEPFRGEPGVEGAGPSEQVGLIWHGNSYGADGDGMDLLQNQVTAVAPVPVVDLTREENEGGVGGPIDLGSPIGLRSPSPLRLDDETADTLEALGRNWEMLNPGEVSTSGEYTPTGP